MARQWYMRDPATRKHHRIDKDPGELGIYIHYPNTCDVHDPETITSAKNPFDRRLTWIETRLVPSRLGWVAICYETKGLMTFFVQLNESRAAWQRIEWEPGFQKKWDEIKVRQAVQNFLWVAESEEARKHLPK